MRRTDIVSVRRADATGRRSAASGALTIASATLAVLALAGCALDPTSGTIEEEEHRPSRVSPGTSAPPLAVEGESNDSGVQYLALLRADERLTAVPELTEEELIAAGMRACAELRDGVEKVDVRVIEGEQPDASGVYGDSRSIADAASKVYCPEYADD